MTYITQTITTALTKAQFESIVPIPGPNEGAINLATYYRAIAAGVENALVNVNIGAIQATNTLVLTGAGASNNETFVINGVTFTGKTSGATGNQFNIGAAATQATNIVAAVNASASVNKQVVASKVGTNVLFTAVHAGLAGNGFTLATSLTNSSVAAAIFANGNNGDAFVLNLA